MTKRTFPVLGWLRGYRRLDLKADLPAGLTVAIMLVPQAMAYAMLAGLPPVTGLYAATVPVIIYALLGSSRQLAVGPVAMVSLLVFVACSRFAEPGTTEYLATVAVLTLMIGVLKLGFGLMRLGFLTHFVSHPVVSGFTAAGAIVIALSQAKHLLGIRPTDAHSGLLLARQLLLHLPDTDPRTLAIGAGSIALLVVFKRRWPRFPAPLLVVALGTTLVFALRLDTHGVHTVGAVPRGFPALSLPAVRAAQLPALAGPALIILFVSFMESIAVAQWVAEREKYGIDANRELIGLGLANIAAACMSGYAVTGGFSRTAVNYRAGARSQLAGLVSGLLVLATLWLLTPLFFYLPKAALAAIIVTAVAGLVDLREARELFRIKTADGATWGLTFAVTLLVGVDWGILAGIVFSLGLFIARSAHPRAVELGYVRDEDAYHDVKRYPHAQTDPAIVILRVDASLYFANMAFVRGFLREKLTARNEARWVVFDLSGVNDMDAGAIRALTEIIQNHGRRGVKFLFAGMKGQVRDLVGRAGWHEQLGQDLDCPDVPHALARIRRQEPAQDE